MKKSEKYIIDALKKDIEESLQIIACEHKWIGHGQGFICKKCKYYTGTNEELNIMIRKELLRKRV